MPVELNTSARYPCESAGCTQSFKSKADREEHYQDTHVASRITHGRLAALPASLPSASNWADLESLENDPLSSDSWGASSKATNVRNIVKCTYKDCSKVFSTEEDMISHKIDASEHDYCPTCPRRDKDGNAMLDKDDQPLYGVDCEDWEDFLKHKTESPYHRTCPCCGQDFNSNAGLRCHVKKSHPKQQTIICPGCDAVFNRAMGLIAHFEWGWCKNPKNPGASISRKQFNDQVVRKSMIKHLLDNVVPETVVDCPTIASAANQDQSTDEIQGHRQGSSALQSQVGGVLLDKPVNIAKLKQPMGSKKSSQSRGGLGAGLALDAIPSLIPTPAASSKAPWSFEAMKRAIDAQYSQNHNASPANEAPIQGTSRHPIVQNAMDLGIEMFSTRFWDPDDKDFSIDIFFNKDTGIYMCPYPTCYNKPKAKEEFVAHLKRPHTLQRVCCPGCYRAFPTCSALIGHCESASEKCRIRHSSMLKEVMDAYSGGILSVKSKPTFRDEQWGDTLKVDSLQNVLEQERQDAASHLRSGNELTLQAQEPQMYW